MIYVERISSDEFNEALKQAYGKLSLEEFWEVRGAIANKEDLCYATKDKSCYYLYQTTVNNLVYFALDKKIQNIKGLYESLYDIVCNGHPYIYFNGLKGRYNIIKKAFLFVFQDDRFEPEENRDYLVIYMAHPENIKRLINKINRGNKQ